MTKSRELRNKFSWILASLGVAAMLSVLPVTPSNAGAPFAGLSGSWAGAGRITMSDGTSEPIKCKATYTVENSDTTLQQILRCASDSYRFNVKSNIDSDGDELSGEWTETTYNLGGSFSGTIAGKKIEGKVRGSGLLVGVALLTNGSVQRVRILSQGTEMREVNLKLNKR
jgi:hypothetical protein